MRYLKARYEQNQREWAYRIYVTDALKSFFGLDLRYADLFVPQKVETRTAEEIISNISEGLAKLGGE